MYVARESLTKIAWLALDTNLAAFVIACVDNIHIHPHLRLL